MLDTIATILYSPTLMSRGRGRIQEAVLQLVADRKTEIGIPTWATIDDISTAAYDIDEPTPAQRESIRRAIHSLAADGLVEITYWPDFAGERTVTETTLPGDWAYCRREIVAKDAACRYCEAGEPPGLIKSTHKLTRRWTTEYKTRTGGGAPFLNVRQTLTDEQQAEVERAAVVRP